MKPASRVHKRAMTSGCGSRPEPARGIARVPSGLRLDTSGSAPPYATAREFRTDLATGRLKSGRASLDHSRRPT